MRRLSWLYFGVVAVPLAACADLDVERIAPASQTDAAALRNANEPSYGDITYYLPRSVVSLAGTISLDECTIAVTPKLTVSANLTPAVSSEPDPDFHFKISYEKARTWTKEINFTVANQAGYLQNFNGQINDQAGPIAVATVGAVIQFAGAAAVAAVVAPFAAPPDFEGGRTPPLPVLRPAKKDFCTPEVKNALAAKKNIQHVIDKLNEKVPTTSVAVAVQNKQLQAQQALLDKQNKILTRAVSFKWIPTSADLKPVDSYYVASEQPDFTDAISAWLTNEGQASLRAAAKDASDPRQSLIHPLLVTLAVDARTMGKELDDKQTLTPKTTLNSPGLVLRDPATATLRVCRTSDSNQSDCNMESAASRPNHLVDMTNDVGPRLAVELPQFGRILVLPEHSALFEDATLTATLAADGTISTYGYHSVSTAATQIQALGTAGASAQSAIAARNTAIGAENTAAAATTTANINQIQGPDTFNKALADCLTQQATINTAGGTPMSCQ